MRSTELEAALTVLGVTEHHWLDYDDGACASVDPAEAATRLGRLLDDVRPDTVITFGQDGFTGHPDHRAVNGWTDLAILGARETPLLLHPVARPQPLDADLDENFNVFELGRPRVCADDELAPDGPAACSGTFAQVAASISWPIKGVGAAGRVAQSDLAAPPPRTPVLREMRPANGAGLADGRGAAWVSRLFRRGWAGRVRVDAALEAA